MVSIKIFDPILDRDGDLYIVIEKRDMGTKGDLYTVLNLLTVQTNKFYREELILIPDEIDVEWWRTMFKSAMKVKCIELLEHKYFLNTCKIVEILMQIKSDDLFEMVMLKISEKLYRTLNDEEQNRIKQSMDKIAALFYNLYS